MARMVRRVLPARPTAAEKPTELVEPTLDTGELEALMTAPSAVGMWGTSTVPAPRPAADLVDADER
jgi:hypothetical protein